MKILKFSMLACSIMTLIACAHANTPGKNSDGWNAFEDISTGVHERHYVDLDSQIKSISFEKIAGASDSDMKKPVLKARRGSKILGEIYQQEFSGNRLIPVMYLHNEKSMNPSNEQDLKKLANAKTFEYYEFGQGRLSHAVFTAKNGICQDFKTQQGVHFNMSSNYYDLEKNTSSVDNYLTYQLNGMYAKDTFSIDEYSAGVISEDKAFVEKYTDSIKQNGDKLPNANAAEKGRMIEQVICR